MRNKVEMQQLKNLIYQKETFNLIKGSLKQKAIRNLMRTESKIDIYEVEEKA